MRARAVSSLSALLLGASTGAAASKPIEEGVIRSTREVIADSDSIYRISILKMISNGCGGARNLYLARVDSAYKGGPPPDTDLEFCGSAALLPYVAYIVGLDREPDGEKLVVSPDAVYFERLPDRYFRMLSYESSEYVVQGRQAVVLGFEEPDLTMLLAHPSRPPQTP